MPYKPPTLQAGPRYDAMRGTAHQRGYTRAWQGAAARWLRANPLCVECKRQGRITAATEVDHISPHRGDKVKFWDANNWQSLCAKCHGIKTASGQ